MAGRTFFPFGPAPRAYPGDAPHPPENRAAGSAGYSQGGRDVNRRAGGGFRRPPGGNQDIAAYDGPAPCRAATCPAPASTRRSPPSMPLEPRPITIRTARGPSSHCPMRQTLPPRVSRMGRMARQPTRRGRLSAIPGGGSIPRRASTITGHGTIPPISGGLCKPVRLGIGGIR